MVLQFVFAVKHRQCLIPHEHKQDLHSYIGGLIKHRGSKPFAIHCMPDHAHILIGYKPTIHIPDLVKEIKVETNQFLNSRGWVPNRFSWQEGYGAFSYSNRDIDRVVRYINNQEAHHATTKFRNEYLALLNEFEITYDERYLFEFFD